MDAILLVGTQGAELRRYRSHLLKKGFQVVAVEPEELERLEEEGKGRFLLGLVDATGAGRLLESIERVRRLPFGRTVPWMVLVKEGQLRELQGLEGLQDFLVAPVSPEMLEARIRFVLGRLNHLAPGSGIRIGALELNVDRYELTLDAEPLELTYKEFELFKFLATHPGRVFSRDQLLNEVWGYNFIGGTRTVDVHVRRLRAKLGPKYASLIDTVRNVGYKFLESL